MKTYPIACMDLEAAKAQQFRLLEAYRKAQLGKNPQQMGDLGVVLGLGRPKTTAIIEKTLAEAFAVDDAILLRGAGTAAIAWSLSSVLRPGDKVLVHTASMYHTTKTSFERLGLEAVPVDYNDEGAVLWALREKGQKIAAVFIQHSRQALEDHYDLKNLISLIKTEAASLPILCDENYAAFKAPQIGVELGADLSTFSAFKLLGPEGVGIVMGKAPYIASIRRGQYSGGSQVQGHEALEVLRGMILAPVSLAVQTETVYRCCEMIKALAHQEIDWVAPANAQSLVLLLAFKKPIAEAVLAASARLGVASYPVGCESKYDLLPLFYRVSGSMRDSDACLEKHVIRINPLKAGPETVLAVLVEAIQMAVQELRATSCS